jgi:hypothetical protein
MVGWYIMDLDVNWNESSEVLLAVSALCAIAGRGRIASLERPAALLAERSVAALAGEGVGWAAASWELAHLVW